MIELSRKEFLKKTLIGAAAIGLFGRGVITEAATSKVQVTDNLYGGFHIGDTAPQSRKMGWVDTSSGQGVLRFYNGTAWVPTKSVWG